MCVGCLRKKKHRIEEVNDDEIMHVIF